MSSGLGTDLSFKYTARDFASIREELRLLMLRGIPEWVDSPSSFEGVLMDQFAYIGDILNFYVDRLGSEAYLQTAVRRESLINIAFMFGYVPTPQTAASGYVTFTKAEGLGDVIVPAGTQVFAQAEGFDPIIFETTSQTVITEASAEVPVTEGVTVTEELLGASTGGPSQVLSLFNKDVIKGSVRVFTKDGNVDSGTGEPALMEWTFTERIIDGEFYERAFSLYVNANGNMYVQFGDGTTGAIPPTGVEVYATYRYGTGAGGNVAAGAVKSLVTGGELTGRVQSVTNAAAMQGGADAESIESMRKSIPKSIRAIERAVTAKDFESLSQRVGGVAKASVNPASSVTSVQVAIAPVGGGLATSTLQASVEAYLAERKMVGVDVVAVSPDYVPINVSIDVQADPRYRNDDVAERVAKAVNDLYAFDNVDFGQRMAKAIVFRSTVDIEGVEYLSISAFNRDGEGADADFTLDFDEIPEIGNLAVTVVGGIAAA